MKKLLTVLLLTFSVTAFAQHNHHWRHHGHNGGPGFGYWVAPLVIGGVVGAAVANNRRTETVIIEQQPVIVQPQQPNCTAWKEVQTPDGKTYRERTCYGLQ